MTQSTLLIRADASVAMGTGHVMRCLALAQAWQDSGGRALFAMAETAAALQKRLSQEGFEAVSVTARSGSDVDSKQTAEFAQEHGADWIAVDGYQFTSRFQQELKAAGFRVVFLDDFGHGRPYSADIVLNQNAGADADQYVERNSHTRLLLGASYALLRREFAPWRAWRRTVSTKCQKLLVLMGGGDSENLTAKVIQALNLANLEHVEADVVVGSANPHLAELEKAAAQSQVLIHLRLSVSSMGELMAGSDVAISAAGSTCWELCLLGLPMLLVDAAPNQTPIAKALNSSGCAIHAGNWTVTPEAISENLTSLVLSQELRQRLSNGARQLVDGNGAQRVVAAMRGPGPVHFRPATFEDQQMLWEWANDPEVRAASFSTQLIPWETHVKWIAEKISNPQTLLWIAEDQSGMPIGQVRLDLHDREADVSISLATPKRGSGFAAPTITAAISQLFSTRDCKRVHAYIRPENIASARSFERAGFVQKGTAVIRGTSALHFVRECD